MRPSPPPPGRYKEDCHLKVEAENVRAQTNAILGSGSKPNGKDRGWFGVCSLGKEKIPRPGDPAHGKRERVDILGKVCFLVLW